MRRMCSRGKLPLKNNYLGQRVTEKVAMALKSFKINLTEEDFARSIALNLDLPGIFFVEAAARIQRGEKKVLKLRQGLKRHAARLTSAQKTQTENKSADAWVDVIQGVGSLESIFGNTISEFAVADVLLVAAAEAYVNSVAAHVLGRSEFDQFDKLSPVGKWLFLPKAMNLKWKPSLAKGCLQQFASVVTRRNRTVHPRVVRVRGVVEVDAFLKQLSLDPHQAKNGLTAVADLIRGISLSWRGSYGPDWLNPDSAAEHAPCFYVGSVEGPGRLGRPEERRAKKK